MSTANTMFDGLNWALFASYSPYSPLNLRNLPQPLPKDSDSTPENNVFTYEDAFEDLLAVSMGKPMMDLQSRSSMRKLLSQMFPTGEPVSFWIQRLNSQGLLKSPFLPRDSIEFSGPMSWRGQFQDDSFGPAQDRLRIEGDSPNQHVENTNGNTVPGLFSQLDQLFRHFDSKIERGSSKESTASQRDPDSFEEMYQTLESAFSEGQRSLSSLLSLLKVASNDFPTTSQLPSHTLKGATDNQVESFEEHTDDAGNHHTKKTVRTLDANGREIACQTEYTMRSPGLSTLNDANGNPQPVDQTSQKDDTAARKSSWYWK
jgi:hypothetical protein